MSLIDWVKVQLGRAPRSDLVPLPSVVPPPQTIDEVIAAMRAIQAQLPAEDGVAQFNRMYLAITEEVGRASRGHDFEDTNFLERLDVIFANLYFQAIEDYARAAGEGPKAWAPLMEARSNGRIAPIQFALAGMNAHINHDLVIAVVDTCRAFDLEPKHDSPQYRDFVYVNELLTRAQEKVEPWFKRGPLGLLDRFLGRADEVAEMWSMQRAREAAWVQAEALWRLGGAEPITGRFLLTLDRTVGFAGRGLLIERPL